MSVESFFYKDDDLNKHRYNSYGSQVDSEFYPFVDQLFKKWCGEHNFCPRELAYILMTEVNTHCMEYVLFYGDDLIKLKREQETKE